MLRSPFLRKRLRARSALTSAICSVQESLRTAHVELLNVMVLVAEID